MTDIKNEPVAWVVRIKKTHEFCDPTELYGDTAEEVVEISRAWNSEYSDPIPLYTHPAPALTAELREELLAALFIGRGAFDVRTEAYRKVQAAITKLTNLDSRRERMNDKTLLELTSETKLMIQAVIDNLGVAALKHGKMSVFDAFVLGWMARAAIAKQGEK